MSRVSQLDVPRHESRHSEARRKMRFNQQPQFRRTAGAGRPHASSQSDDGGCGSNYRTLHGYSQLAVQLRREDFSLFVGEYWRHAKRMLVLLVEERRFQRRVSCLK